MPKSLKNKTPNRYHNSVGHLDGTAKANCGTAVALDGAAA
jgi:hypothetical protein